MKKGVKKYPNHTKTVIPVKIISQTSPNNRHAKRADVAWKRGKKMRDRKSAAEHTLMVQRTTKRLIIERQQSASHRRALARLALKNS